MQRKRLDPYVLSELRMRGAELPVGASTNGGICPACRGGSSSEKSFSLTRVDATRLAYCCHRATCGSHGYIGGTVGDLADVYLQMERNTRRSFSCETRGLDEFWLSALQCTYGFTTEAVSHFGWTQEVDSGRLVVRICDPDGKARGVHTRGKPGAYPKSRDYRLGNETWMGWYRGVGGGLAAPAVVLVEDVLSAAKVAMAGYKTASLMGCDLSLDKLAEAQAAAQGQVVVLALDRDATTKAIELVSKYSFLSGGNLIPLLLSKDLKYHDIEEIQAMVNDVVKV